MVEFGNTSGAIVEDVLVPKFAIKVGHQTIENNIGKFVQSVEYESTENMADVARIRCFNNDNMVSNAKALQPGNEMSLYMGYGNKSLVHIGRTVIIKQIPIYPQEGVPFVTIVGYTKDYAMTDNSPEKSKDRRFKKTRYDEAIEIIASRYDMKLDIDRVNMKPKNFIQKAGVSDYEFTQGLSNLTGYTFWVDGDEFGEWTLHFKEPYGLEEQDKTYTFEYDNGDLSTLLFFRPELLIKGAKTKIAVVIKDVKTGKVIKAEVEEENDQAPDMDATTDPLSDVSGPYTTASDIKLFFNDFSFQIISERRFKTEAEAIFWAQQWFRRNREDFILASGKSVGLESLMARQRHIVKGISPAYNGKFYFSKVKHVLNPSSGYYCNFSCRRIVP